MEILKLNDSSAKGILTYDNIIAALTKAGLRCDSHETSPIKIFVGKDVVITVEPT